MSYHKALVKLRVLNSLLHTIIARSLYRIFTLAQILQKGRIKNKHRSKSPLFLVISTRKPLAFFNLQNLVFFHDGSLTESSLN